MPEPEDKSAADELIRLAEEQLGLYREAVEAAERRWHAKRMWYRNAWREIMNLALPDRDDDVHVQWRQPAPRTPENESDTE